MLSPAWWGRVWLVLGTLLMHYRRHLAQGVFLLLGLSLGVAILLGTLMVGQAAKSAFSQAEQTINGDIVGYIRPANGRTTLPESLYVQLRRQGITHLVPQVEGQIQLQNNRFVTLMGLDVFAFLQNSSGQNQQGQNNNAFDSLSLVDFSFAPYQLWVSDTLMQVHDLTVNATPVLKDGRTLPPVVPINDEVGSGYNLLCDLRCAQAVLGFEQQLTAIALTRKPADIDKLTQSLPTNTRLQMVTKNAQNQALSDAFFLNITAVSLLAFLVGCFIAFNSVRFSVIQRTDLVQQLRMTGVTFSEVSTALALELLFWALLAGIAGCVLGWLIASSLLPSVGLTVAQLFQGKNLLSIPELRQWWFYSAAIALLASILAVAKPFWQLAKTKPLQQQQQTDNHHYTGILGLVMLSLGFLLTCLPHSQNLGFAVTFCWFFGGALLVPFAISGLYWLLSRSKALVHYPKIQWLVADGRFNQARMSVAMMAFTVAIAAGIAVSTMVSSFQIALEDYLDQVLAEDLYLQPRQDKSAAIYSYLSQHPDVKLAYRFYHTSAEMSKQGKVFKSFVRGITNDGIRHQSIALERHTKDIWQKLHRNEGIIVNQTLAFQQKLNIGDRLQIKRNGSAVEVEVLGVYYSYGATIPSMIMSQQWLKTLWPAVQTVEIGVFLHANKAIDSLIEDLKTRFSLSSNQAIKPQTIKALALKIFGQTFEATQLLSIFTLLIAAIGIYCACYSAQLAQQRQLTLLKVLGINHKTLTGLATAQLLLNTLVAALIALPLGSAIAWASVQIVLQYSFGWHFAIVLDPMTVLLILGSAVLIALLSGAIPLYRQGKRSDIESFGETA